MEKGEAGRKRWKRKVAGVKKGNERTSRNAAEAGRGAKQGGRQWNETVVKKKRKGRYKNSKRGCNSFDNI